MEPAYPLALTQEDHAIIGELAEIIGQIDSIMIETVARLGNDPDVRKKMGAGVAFNLAVWADTIRRHVNEPSILKIVSVAESCVKDLPELRNDFIHAHFTGDYAEPGYMKPGYQTTSAVRIRSGKSRSVSDLPRVRELAALVSCLVAHVDYLTTEGTDRGPSRWLRRLAPFLTQNT